MAVWPRHDHRSTLWVLPERDVGIQGKRGGLKFAAAHAALTSRASRLALPMVGFACGCGTQGCTGKLCRSELDRSRRAHMDSLNWTTRWEHLRELMGTPLSARRRTVNAFLQTRPCLMYWDDSWFSTPLYLNLAKQSMLRVDGIAMVLGKSGATAAGLFTARRVKELSRRWAYLRTAGAYRRPRRPDRQQCQPDCLGEERLLLERRNPSNRGGVQHLAKSAHPGASLALAVSQARCGELRP